MPDENKASPPAGGTLESQAEAYLEAQKELAEAAYNASTISIVLGLMPADDHPQGRLGILSVRNDQDAPLFDTPLRGEELAPLLEAPPIARLLAELKALLPQRLEERQRKEGEKPQTVSHTVSTTSTTGAKSAKKATDSEVSSTQFAPNRLSGSQAQPDYSEASAKRDAEEVSAPTASLPSLEGKSTQLTLF